MTNSEIEQRARTARDLFEFLAGWKALALQGEESEVVKADIVSGSEPFVLQMVLNKIPPEEREALRQLDSYRRTIYNNSVMMDAGYGRKERVFANLYDALFAHLKMHGEKETVNDNYRGHLDSRWKLEASYYRSLSDRTAPHDDRANVISSFYGIHVVPVDESNDEQLAPQLARIREKYPKVKLNDLTPLQKEAVIQHYVSGTKLLDFTKSIYVAAFFATNNFSQQISKTRPEFGAIYRIANIEINELSMGQVEAPELPMRFARIHRQRGVFLKIRFRGAINDPGLWARWVFRHTNVAYPFHCAQHQITLDHLLPEEI